MLTRFVEYYHAVDAFLKEYTDLLLALCFLTEVVALSLFAWFLSSQHALTWSAKLYLTIAGLALYIAYRLLMRYANQNTEDG
jgi:hypothetical protein